MKYIMMSVMVITILFSCAQQKEKVDLAAEKSAVKSTIDQMTEAMQSEDMQTFSSIVAHDPDMVVFGTDAAERWVGWDAFKAALQQQFEAFSSSKASVSKQVITVDSSGHAAWFSEVLDWSIETQGQQVELEGARVTGVLQKRNDKWVFVQMHFSVPVSGQAAEY